MMNRLWRRLTPRSLALLLIGVPLLLASLYYGLMAQDRYVSTAVMSVRRAHQDSYGGAGLAMLIPGVGGASLEDTRMLQDYMRSQALLQRLDAEFGLRRHYESATRDPFFRLWPGVSQEWWVAYWRSRLSLSIDELSGLLTVQVQTFDPVLSQQVAGALLRESESFVNGVTQRIAREQMAFAQTELTLADERLGQARNALLAFQARHRMLDPAAQAQATSALAAELHAQLARVEAELSAKAAFLNPEAPDILNLRAQAAALRLQVARETRNVASTQSDALNRLSAEFRDLKARTTLAEELLKGTLASVEASRIEALRKAKSLVVVEPPTLAESAEYPRRVYDMVTLLIASLLLYAVTRLVVATVNEHRD